MCVCPSVTKNMLDNMLLGFKYVYYRILSPC